MKEPPRELARLIAFGLSFESAQNELLPRFASTPAALHGCVWIPSKTAMSRGVQKPGGLRSQYPVVALEQGRGFVRTS
jgi:hypothetical protein